MADKDAKKFDEALKVAITELIEETEALGPESLLISHKETIHPPKERSGEELKIELLDLMSAGQVFRTVQLEGRTRAALGSIRTAISDLAKEGLLVVHGDTFEDAFIAATPKLFNRK